MKKLNLVGKRFGRLEVVSKANAKDWRTYWKCKCRCGQVKIIRGTDLKTGKTKSCGCYKKGLSPVRNLQHGHRGQKYTSPSYRTWTGMKTRCTNPNTPDYDRYGGRGITVCKRWMNSFAAFLKDMGERPIGKTLDRKNNNKNYTPKNCRWATPKEQRENQ